MNQDFSTPKRKKAIVAYLNEKVLPKIEQPLKAVMAIRNKWNLLEGRNQEFSETRDKLKAEIKHLQEQGVMMAQSGGDPIELSQQIHDKQVELVDVEGWIKEINEKIEALRPERFGAEKGLEDALQGEIRPITSKFQEERDGYLAAASEIDSSWFPAVQEFVWETRNTDWAATWRPSPISFPLRVDPKRSNYKKMGYG